MASITPNPFISTTIMLPECVATRMNRSCRSIIADTGPELGTCNGLLEPCGDMTCGDPHANDTHSVGSGSSDSDKRLIACEYRLEAVCNWRTHVIATGSWLQLVHVHLLCTGQLNQAHMQGCRMCSEDLNKHALLAHISTYLNVLTDIPCDDKAISMATHQARTISIEGHRRHLCCVPASARRH
jgi:hypothetical protein